MTLERVAAVEAIDNQAVRLQLSARCDGCSGCGGRCGLFGPLRADDDRIDLPLAWCDEPPRIGSRVRIYLPDRQLLQHARIGYGLPMAGLLLGALLGHWLGQPSATGADVTAVIAAASGTLAGLAFSKRTSPLRCRIAPVD